MAGAKDRDFAEIPRRRGRSAGYACGIALTFVRAGFVPGHARALRQKPPKPEHRTDRKSLFGRYGNTPVTTDLKKRFHGRYGIRNGTDGANTKTEMHGSMMVA
jgi:hypothetical protein